MDAWSAEQVTLLIDNITELLILVEKMQYINQALLYVLFMLFGALCAIAFFIFWKRIL